MEHIEKLTELFTLLDRDKSGKLDVSEFKLLGKAMTGSVPTDSDTIAQIRRADADGDLQLDLTEWLAFSQMLGSLPKELFDQTIDSYINRVRKEIAATSGPAGSRK